MDKSNTIITSNGKLAYRYLENQYTITGCRKQTRMVTDQPTGIVWKMTAKETEKPGCTCHGYATYRKHPMNRISKAICLNCGNEIK